MPAYPSSPIYSYPITRRVQYNTLILTGDNGTEQRCPLTVGEESFTIQYPHLSVAERDTLLAFFETCKGVYEQDIDFPFGVETFNYCYFDSDKFSCVERAQGIWSAEVTLRQLPIVVDVTAYTADFPALSSGHVTQLPFTHERVFDTVVVRTEGGRYRYSKRAASLRTWTAGGTVLSAADAGALYDLFNRTRGRWGTFHFTDPESGTEYTSCRFASDVLEWRYVEPGCNSVQVQLQEFV